MNEWFYDNADNILRVSLSCFIFYIIVIAASKLAGLRSFSTFSSFDFLITLAMGALLATTITSREVSIVEGIIALAGLYIFQMLIAKARQRWGFIKKWIDTPPVLLMRDGQVLRDNLRHVNITEDELKAKLRQQSVSNYGEVKVVVLETSGDISVIRNPEASSTFDPAMLDGVIRRASK